MRRRSPKGSVVLVALSCVTVLGIALASFLALSNQAMKLSNRNYALAVSRQLAQMGLESALRSYNDNSFATAGWTLVPATGTATKNFSISTDHYGSSGVTASVSGITATVKVRVDHYLAAKKATPWSVLLTYVVGDFVWYQGVWYQCTATTTNQAPSNTSYWKSAPESWTPYANYQIGNIVLSGGAPYRCTAANINQVPPNATYWTALSAVAAWSSATSYAVDAVVYSGGMPYRCISAHSNHAPPNTSYWLSAPVIYAEGVAVLPDSTSTTLTTQLRATLAPASLFPNAIGSTNYTNLFTSGLVDSYNSVLGTYGQTSAPFTTSLPNYGASAVVAGGRTWNTAVDINDVRVNGYVAAPSATYSPYDPLWNRNIGVGIVTGTAGTGSVSPKVDRKRISRSPYVPQFDIRSVASVAPATSYYLDNPSGTVNIPRGGEVANPADGKYYYYTSGDLDLGNNDILKVNGPVVIDVRPSSSARVSLLAGGAIIIANNATASLELHFGGLLNVGDGNGSTSGIYNQTFDPKRCILLGTSTVNNSGQNLFFSYQAFYGVIYMPNAYLHVRYESFTVPEQIYGALSASNIYFEHTTNLHYDTSLRTAVFGGVDTPYEIAEWRELTNVAERVILP